MKILQELYKTKFFFFATIYVRGERSMEKAQEGSEPIDTIIFSSFK